MILQQFVIIPVILLMLTTALLPILRPWRYTVGVLAIQFLAVAWLVATVWPIGLAMVKLVVGWMSAAILGATQMDIQGNEKNGMMVQGFLFRLFAMGMIWLVVFSVASLASEWFAVPPYILWGGLILVGGGLLQMGMNAEPWRIFIGLLTTLAGFEVLYAAIESSVLVAGLLALVNLGLALVGSYLLIVEQEELQL